MFNPETLHTSVSVQGKLTDEVKIPFVYIDKYGIQRESFVLIKYLGYNSEYQVFIDALDRYNYNEWVQSVKSKYLDEIEHLLGTMGYRKKKMRNNKIDILLNAD